MLPADLKSSMKQQTSKLVPHHKHVSRNTESYAENSLIRNIESIM
jgi:hypothetical protein